VEIGDRCPTALDLSYCEYAAFVKRAYNIEPAEMSIRIRVGRGISNRSRRGSGGIDLHSGPVHRRRQAERARAASSALSGLTEG
jgi:hypothetical protein